MRNISTAMSSTRRRFCPSSSRHCGRRRLLVHCPSPAPSSLCNSMMKSSMLGIINSEFVVAAPAFTTASRYRSFSSNNTNSSNPRDDRRGQLKQDFAYCRKVVQERDREGFLCGLLLPSEAQNSYFAIRAFNVELASVKDGTNRMRGQQGGGGFEEFGGMSTTIALQIRMQWWRDALHEIYRIDNDNDISPKVGVHMIDNTATAASRLSLSSSISCWKSPIVRALCEANREKKLTKRFLERLIDAREMDIHVKQQLATLKETSLYAEETVSSLLYLTLECMNVREDAADEAASYAGLGIGLVTALRSTPVRWLHHGEIPIPADLWKPSSSWSPLHARQETFRKSEHEEAKQQQQQQVELDEANDQQLSARTVGLVKSAEEEAEFVQAVQEMASTAAAHLTEARKLQGRVPKQGRAALLPVIPALHYLSLLEKAKYNLFDPQLTDHQQSQFRLLLLLGRTWLTGIF